MIKIIKIDNTDWKIHFLDTNKDNEKFGWGESPTLIKFLSEGWNIKDWKTSRDRYNSYWTFILEKEDHQPFTD